MSLGSRRPSAASGRLRMTMASIVAKSLAFVVLGLMLLWSPAHAREPRPAQAKALVKAGVEYVLKEGPEAAILALNDPEGPLSRGPLRLFALDTETGVLRADPLRPQLVGRPVLDLTDAKGKVYYRALVEIALDKGSGWSDHFIVPPGGRWADIEAVYVGMVPGTGLILGCGLFDLDAPTAQAQSGD